MRPLHRIPSHPGVILRTEFLEPRGLSQVAFAAHLGLPVRRVGDLVRGKRGLTSAMAWLLAGAFGTTPEFWLRLQVAHDLALSRPAQPVRRLGPFRG